MESHFKCLHGQHNTVWRVKCCPPATDWAGLLYSVMRQYTTVGALPYTDSAVQLSITVIWQRRKNTFCCLHKNWYRAIERDFTPVMNQTSFTWGTGFEHRRSLANDGGVVQWNKLRPFPSDPILFITCSYLHISFGTT